MQLLEDLQKQIEKTEDVVPGRVLEIVQYDNPTLREKSQPYLGDITTDTRTKQLVADMIATMQAAGAVGLAAIQVGVPVRILVVQDAKKEPYVVINPAVIEEDTEKVRTVEGCLSFPGLFMPVWRAMSVVVKCLTLEGKPITIQADNLLGRAILHEIDHLDGVLFTDRVPKILASDASKKMEVHQRRVRSFRKRQKENQAKLKALMAKHLPKEEAKPE